MHWTGHALRSAALFTGLMLPLALAACSTDDSDGPSVGPLDTGDGTVSDDTDRTGCGDERPMCAFGCGGDVFEVPDCVNDQWVCPPNTNPIDECPPGSCFGAPLPGEVCEDGWTCQPWLTTALDTCPAFEMLCADCTRFAEPYDTEACTCQCDDGFVTCASDACDVTSTSDLPDVALELTPSDCTWTIAEAAAGITFDYRIVVADAVSEVMPQPQDAGGCGQPDASGLIPFGRIDGNDQTYCICDEGNCAPQETSVTLFAGTTTGSFTWDGRNFNGPSDTGQQPGDPFPAGVYVVSVSARGTYGPEGTPFTVASQMNITLTP